MIDTKTFTVSVTKTYSADVETLLNLFRNSTVFELTGADEIESEFKEGGTFRLTFINRGTIHGHFTKITNNAMILDWNVDGFNRPSEVKTTVGITFRQDQSNCILTLNHKNIVHEEAAQAKQRAWTEILGGIAKRMEKK